MVLPLVLGIVGSLAGSALGGALGASIGYAMGSLLGTMLSPTKGPDVVGPRLEDLSLQTSSNVADLPRAYGTVAHRGNMIWAQGNSIIERVSRSTKKKKVLGFTVAKQTTETFTYYLTAAVAFVKVPPDTELQVLRIWVGDKLVVNNTSDDLETALISGKAAEDYFTIYTGTDDQQPDPLIVADVGEENASGYPGILYIVVKDFPLADFFNSVSRAELKVEYSLSFTSSEIEFVRNVEIPDPGDHLEEPEFEYNAAYMDASGLHVWRVGPGPGTSEISDSMFTKAEYLLSPAKAAPLFLRTVPGEAAGLSAETDSVVWPPFACKGKSDRNVFVCAGCFDRLNEIADVTGGELSISRRWQNGEVELNLIGFIWGTVIASLNSIVGTGAPFAPTGGTGTVWYFNSFGDALQCLRILLPGPHWLFPGTSFTQYTNNSNNQVLVTGPGIIFCDNGNIGISRFRIDNITTDFFAPAEYVTEESFVYGSISTFVLVHTYDADNNELEVARLPLRDGGSIPPNNTVHYAHYQELTFVAMSFASGAWAGIVVFRIDGGRWSRTEPLAGSAVSSIGVMSGELVVIANNGSDATIYRFDLDLGLVETFNSASVAALFGSSGSSFYENASVERDRVLFYLDDDLQYLASWNGSSVVIGDASATFIGGPAESYFNVYQRGSIIAAATMGGALTHVGAQFYTAGIPAGASVTLADIVREECKIAGLEESEIDVTALTQEVRGFRIARRGSVRNVIQQLQLCFPFDAVQSGYTLKFVPRGQSPAASVGYEDLGQGIQWQSEREQESLLPAKVLFKYLDRALEYEIGDQYSERPIDSDTEQEYEVPIVLTPDEAARVADVLHSLFLVERTTYGPFQLPPPYRELEPSDVITVNTAEASYEVRITDIEYRADGSLICSGKPNAVPIYTSNAVGESPPAAMETIPAAGIVQTVLADIPVLVNEDDPGIFAAMSGLSENWVGGALWRSPDGGVTWQSVQGFPGAVPFGVCGAALGEHACHLPDLAGSLTVQLYSGSVATVSETDWYNEALLLAYGSAGRWEILSARTVADNGGGSFTLSGFLRGLRGTEWATGLHATGDLLVLVSDEDFAFIDLDESSIDTVVSFRGANLGGSIDNMPDSSVTYEGVNLKPLSPAYASAEKSGSDIVISWVRRDRLGISQWLDFGPVPMSEATEEYEIEILDGEDGNVLRTVSSGSAEFTYTEAMQVADFGSEVYELWVRIYQVSAVVGLGYPLQQFLGSRHSSAYSSDQWRIYIDANNGWTNTSIAEIVFYDESAAPISLSGGTAAASSQFSGSFVPANAFDGNSTSRWATANGAAAPSWISYTFTAPVTPYSLSIQGPPTAAGDAPRDFRIQYYDGANWQDAATYTGETGWTGGETRNFTVQ